MSFILALDQGTTSSRAVLFDSGGAIKAIAQQELHQIYPQPGWVEHDPNEIWQTQIDAAHAVINQAGITAADIAAIGITNQRETTVVWDRATGQPIHNAIVWQDRRTASLCDELKAAGHEPAVNERSGLLLDAYFSATKIAWMLDHIPQARARAQAGELAFGTIDAWLIWKLSGGAVHVTDASNAARTMLFDIFRGEWSPELLRLFGIPRAMLPDVVPSSGIAAETANDLFAGRIPIAGIAGDQQAALFGQRCVVPGMIKNTYGTGCFMLMHTGDVPVRSRNRLLTTIAWRLDGRDEYALEGSVFIAGAVVQWLRDNLGVISSAAESEALAASVSDNGGVYFVPAFAGLGSPHWDAYARGAIVGLTRGSTAAHIARAALESIAYQTADVLHAMQADSGITLSELRVDGGATRNNLLMQFQADLMGVRVVRSSIVETTALGAAYLAGLGVGFWKNTNEIDAQWRGERTFVPTLTRADAHRLREHWNRAVGRSQGWIIK